MRATGTKAACLASRRTCCSSSAVNRPCGISGPGPSGRGGGHPPLSRSCWGHGGAWETTEQVGVCSSSLARAVGLGGTLVVTRMHLFFCQWRWLSRSFGEAKQIGRRRVARRLEKPSQRPYFEATIAHKSLQVGCKRLAGNGTLLLTNLDHQKLGRAIYRPK